LIDRKRTEKVGDEGDGIEEARVLLLHPLHELTDGIFRQKGDEHHMAAGP
jgi:hypothetical protein